MHTCEPSTVLLTGWFLHPELLHEQERGRAARLTLWVVHPVTVHPPG